MTDLVLREFQTMPDLNALVDLQQAIWGMTLVETASPHTMKAIVHTGGVVIGAELDGRLVGFCFGFGVWRNDTRLLWSHMAGVLPEFREQGIGFKIKQAQRRWALDHGYTIMSWTFDPMQRGNANFNLHLLGAEADIYLVEHYGEMTDEINAGLASDRLEARWRLDDERVAAAAEDGPPDGPLVPIDAAACLLRVDEQGALIHSPETAFERRTCFIEIPYRVNAMKRSDKVKTRQWQMALRESMQAAFARGYVAVDFVSQSERGWYVLKR